MARLAVGAIFGLVVGVLAGAALGIKASDDAVDQTDLEAAATEAGVDPQDLLGAVVTTHLSPRAYLVMTGELAPPPRPRDNVDKLIDCLEWFESRGDPNAVNRSSGASGPLQFLLGTWLGTPQGRAGYSRFDISAAHAAARWMIGQGRLHEWSTWRSCA